MTILIEFLFPHADAVVANTSSLPTSGEETPFPDGNDFIAEVSGLKRE